LNYQREAANCLVLLASGQQISSVDIAYALHRLNLYANRMIRVQATKDRLNEDLAAIQAVNPVQGKYTTNSWASYQKALTFAVSVNAQSAAAVDGTGEYILRQTKVDTAREKLIEAYKQLILLTGCILPADGSGTVVDLLNGFIYGLAPGSGAPGKVKAAPGYSLLFHNGPNGPGTGSTVEALPKTGKAASVFYTVVIYGDVNGDANIDSIDAGIVVDYENKFISWEKLTNAANIEAGDVNGDGNIDSTDAGIIVDSENKMVTIDQSTGLTVPS
ncbi:MAG: dockerin type I domain-containing protein, partial [Eubacteriales bacterium]